MTQTGEIMFENFEFRAAPIALAEGDAGPHVLRGYASVFDAPYPVWDFTEVVRAGAFKDTLTDPRSKSALLAHDDTAIIGSTSNNSLTMKEDEKGLHVEIKLPDTQAGRDAYELVRAGYVQHMSFRFVATKQRWTFSADGKSDVREILKADLYEVSLTPTPASAATSVEAHSRAREQRQQEQASGDVRTRLACEIDLLVLEQEA